MISGFQAPGLVPWVPDGDSVQFAGIALLWANIINRATLGALQNDRTNTNGVPVARHRLILRQHGATAFSMLFVWVSWLYDDIINRSLIEMGSQGSEIRIYPYFDIKVALSIFL